MNIISYGILAKKTSWSNLMTTKIQKIAHNSFVYSPSKKMASTSTRMSWRFISKLWFLKFTRNTISMTSSGESGCFRYSFGARIYMYIPSISFSLLNTKLSGNNANFKKIPTNHSEIGVKWQLPQNRNIGVN